MTLFKRDTVLKCVRVRGIVLDDSDKELFDLVGQWNGIGTIFYEEVDRPTTTLVKNLQQAKPCFPNIKNYPLINEIVYLFLLTDDNIYNNLNSYTSYYLSPINIWNHPNHNAIPETTLPDNLEDSQKQDYGRTQAGAPFRRVQDEGTGITLGRTFQESAEINPLRNKEGDVQVEGRFGQSLNFTSNTESQKPLTILRTGQATTNSQPPWIPLYESIAADANIFIQSVDTGIESGVVYNGEGMSETDTSGIDEYSQPQTVMLSDRVVIAAKKDSIVLNSNKATLMSTDGDTYIESKIGIVLSAPSVKLGSANAEESVILGDTFLKDLQELNTALSAALRDMVTVLGNLGIPVTAPIAGALLNASSKALKVANEIGLKSYQSANVKVKK
jgi:hypothetical protein